MSNYPALTVTGHVYAFSCYNSNNGNDNTKFVNTFVSMIPAYKFPRIHITFCAKFDNCGIINWHCCTKNIHSIKPMDGCKYTVLDDYTSRYFAPHASNITFFKSCEFIMRVPINMGRFTKEFETAQTMITAIEHVLKDTEQQLVLLVLQFLFHSKHDRHSVPLSSPKIKIIVPNNQIHSLFGMRKDDLHKCGSLLDDLPKNRWEIRNNNKLARINKYSLPHDTEITQTPYITVREKLNPLCQELRYTMKLHSDKKLHSWKRKPRPGSHV